MVVCLVSLSRFLFFGGALSPPGVLVTPADCELAPAVDVTQRVLAMLNKSSVPVLSGKFPERYNPFPKVWRELLGRNREGRKDD